jgi:hypothetical protein
MLDAIPPNVDTPPAVLPDAALPKLDTNPPDAPADLPVATGGAGGKEAGTGGTGGSDGSVDRPSPGPDAADAAGDGGGEDGGDGGFVCATPKAAWGYDTTEFSNIAWDTDGSLITAVTYFPLITSHPDTFGSKLVTSHGSSDLLLAKIDPSSGEASWLVTVGDEQDQNVTSAALSNAGLGVIGRFMGSLDVFDGDQPTKVILNSGTTLVDFIAGFNDADGSGLWAKKVNLGNGDLTAIAGQPGKDFFVVCGSADNNAASLAVTGTTTAPGTPGGGLDVVVAAIKASDGSVIWSHLFGGANDQMCTSAALDDSGNAIFAGSYAGVLDFGPGALSPAPTDSTHAILWVAKFNGTTGATMAAKAFGTTGQVQTNSTGVTADAQGNVIVAGEFYGPMTFGSTTLTPLGTADTFVAKLDASLVPIWARRWGGSSGIAGAPGVAVDSSGNATVVSDFNHTIDVGPGNTILTSNGAAQPGNFNPLVVSLDGATGQTLCAHAYGDASFKAGNAVAVAVNRQATGAAKDTTAIVGFFAPPGIDFGGPTTPLVAPSGVGTGQGFLLRM